MFEGHVLYLLRKYLGEYIEGLSTEALRISVWQGDVVLKDLKLKAEALNSLRLPVVVKAGFVGTITLKVPWKSLGKDPVVVLIDRLYVLAHPAPDGQTLTEEDQEKLFQAKLQQIEVAEAATLEATSGNSKGGIGPHGGGSWMHNLVGTVIGNLKVTISNVHIRYEDSVSNSGHPFCSGITLSKLAAVTVDEDGNETFDTAVALDKLRKSLELQRLAVYHDSDSSPWNIVKKWNKKWETLSPKEWSMIFQDGIDEQSANSSADWAANRTYLVSPINGILKYKRLGEKERGDPNIPFEKASLVLDDVSLTITEAQYYDGIKLLETFSRFRTRVDVSHLRPVVPVTNDPRAWWRYAMLAGLRQKKLCYWFSWDRTKHLCQLRRSYVQMYASYLQHPSTFDVSEIRRIEKILDTKVLILWRLLGHAKAESMRSKEALNKTVTSKGGWWSFGWHSSEEVPEQHTNVGPEPVEEERLTKEEWQAVNKLLSYQADEAVGYKIGPNMIRFWIDVSIPLAAARIISIDKTEVLCGRFEQLCVMTKLYSKSVRCDITLRYCGLSSPEGTLAESAFSEEKANALEATFVHAPIDQELDWTLAAKISPCHVTVIRKSYERCMEFVKRSSDVSPTVTMETATALQARLQQVTRKAQEQIQMVFEEQSRFGLDIDLDAPKVCVPLRDTDSLAGNKYFLLDFGHFTLRTRDAAQDEERQGLYSRFYITGRDMAAFFVEDVTSARGEQAEKLDPQHIMLQGPDDPHHICYLLDRCGLSVMIDQIKIPHPDFPSTRVSVQVPNLGVHFSPKRNVMIMGLLDILYSFSASKKEGSDEDSELGMVSWYPADLETDARILVWRGLGNSMAEWHSCHLVLSGVRLYVLDCKASRKYQRCNSMAGRQIFEVPLTSIGGFPNAVAISSRGTDIQKALESTSTVILQFKDEQEKILWIRELVNSTYSASTLPEMSIFGEPANVISESSTPKLGYPGSVDLIVSGTVVETKLSLYGKMEKECTDAAAEETIILELLANGGKVNLVKCSGDLTMKLKLHSLRIKDELQGRSSLSSEYLAYSVTSNVNDTNDEDIFGDALSEFVSSSDHGINSPNNYVMSLLDPDVSDYPQDSQSNVYSFDNDQAKVWSSETFYEAEDTNASDFVVLTFITRSPDSHLYHGTDTQMSIRMSALEFYCNRPTLVTLINFGLDVSMANSRPTGEENIGLLPDSAKQTGKDDSGRTVVKGLLGYGKGRVTFNLKMDVDRVSIFLNKEDGSQLAMFVQEKFLLDFKVHPGSISINGTLGNMRLCDMSLGTNHQWGWLCDIRKPGAESLIKFTFKSYSAEDDDYQGYDYSLSGRLSAVRIVFLYRFIQEFTSYFMELATPHTEEAIKLIDKVGGFEWLIQKYEIDGATAVKLDLSLDTPIIVIPKNSTSEDYIHLDLGQLEVHNSFSWHGSKENDPSAVRLDILQADINGINMAVGVNNVMGKMMVPKCEGFHVEVRRSLRDVFRKVPTMSVEVQVGFLHGVISDKEYNVISSCLSTNLSESPNLPPSFREDMQRTKESIRLIADKVNLNNHIMLSRTVFVMAVEIQHALFELCTGPDAESPLAEIALEGLWISYRTTSLLEMDVYVSIPNLSVRDIRLDTKPEMQLMLGSYSDSSKLGFYEIVSTLNSIRGSTTGDAGSKSGGLAEPQTSRLTMLIMDYRWRSSFQSFVIRVQQPRILVVLDFLLAVAEFFVPSLSTITGREEVMDPKNDPLIKSDNVILTEPVYLQKEQVVVLSPRKQLIVDGCGVDEFVYDGCGGTLSLCEEFDRKGQIYSGAIILVGRGKTLRFKNVKIENGQVLRRCVYLNNGSSYTVSAEDGVELSLQESSSNENDVENSNSKEQVALISGSSTYASSDTPFNFTFEAQVVSPELIFYDSAKLSMDDSLHIEKLLRAKMDFSFMYALKEKDTWSRAVIKDLTIEAGSGLVVLEPVDISCKYTSVSEKTNLSLTSTDICIHLSLSVASLILKLQNQTLSALQFGDISPLISCTNFKRIWVSPEGDLPGYNLTFWRPQAPKNYAILGDCVSSRPVPPTQVVVAVSNRYGRVRRPVGFELICVLPSSVMSDKPNQQSTGENECSIWIPVPPQGYSAMGCVAYGGKEPPPNNVVYCLRSDLVTSSKISDCLHYLASCSGLHSGLSIWRVDNVICSFFAYNSLDQPSNSGACDLHMNLLRNPNCFVQYPTSNQHTDKEKNDDVTDSKKNSSGWDVLRRLSKPSSYCMSTPHFERIWWDRGGDQRKPTSIWRPVPRQGFASFGDCITEGMEPPALGVVFQSDSSMVSEKPTQFTKVAQIVSRGLEAYFWYPVPPPGYVSLGCVVTTTDSVPRKESICCPRVDLVSQANISDEPISWFSSSKGQCWSIWKVENQASTFLARPDLKKPSVRLAYSIAGYEKPKAQENYNADLKLSSLSVSILDSSCGTVSPLCDMTITNLNLASHGKFESMNAVLICSIAASTFNRQLESWEPLIEPFDGIFKLETYEGNENPSSKSGKKIRVAATTALNVNLSTANLETLVEALICWKQQEELESKSSKKIEDVDENKDLSKYALDEDDFQQVIIENKLGCDVYIRKTELFQSAVELLQHDSHALLLMPPARFSDKLNVVSKSADARYYFAVQIFESKDIPIIDDGNNHDYFCALRLLLDSSAADSYKLFPQSARTRCTKPLKVQDTTFHHVRWNELFIFEVPGQGTANLEIEVTNLASKAGKGEVVGVLSIPIGQRFDKLKRATSVKILRHAADFRHVSTYSLMKKGQMNTIGGQNGCGSLLLSTCYFERNFQTKFHSGRDNIASRSDVGFSVGLSGDGPWEVFSSILPLSIIPKSLNNSLFAFEITMRNGKKHAVMRSLATIMNDSGVILEVSVCPVNMIYDSVSNVESISCAVTEEIFENQRFHPTSGWGNKAFGSNEDDNNHWSTRDFSYSSKDFFEPPLPTGWKWASPWRVERSRYVDGDGWAYASDFSNLQWPPSSSKYSSKSALDVVRRRRWTRSRQQFLENSKEVARNVIAVVNPHSSAELPWTTMLKDMDLCLQVRPITGKSQESYSWSQSLSLALGSTPSNQPAAFSRQSTMKQSSDGSSILRLSQLEKKDFLVYCYQNISKEYFWLSIGVDASILQAELNFPIYDWKISVHSIVRLESKLPYEAEFSILEKSPHGSMVVKQHGVVSSNGIAYIYSADIRKSVYLTLSLQGGWTLEKDAILIMDIFSLDRVASFWMVQRQSKRRIRVSVEHDMGGSDVAPKAVRLFVPYWLQNESSIPLSYRIVEMDQFENIDADPQGRSVKSGKFALRQSSKSLSRKSFASQRNINILETIEDSYLNVVMLSPQDYLNRTSVLLFQSKSDSSCTARVGVSVAVGQSTNFSMGIPLLELEAKECVDVKAFDSNGSYYWLSAQLKMASDRTKVVHFLPRTLFVNRIGRTIYLAQSRSQMETYHASDPPKLLKWHSDVGDERVMLRMDGYDWSRPFSVESHGTMCIAVNHTDAYRQMYVKIQVRGGTSSSRFEVVFQLPSWSSLYRIENRSMFVPIRVRQVDGNDKSWYALPPNSSVPFFWEDLGRRHLLEVLADETGALSSGVYDIDEVSDHKPNETMRGRKKPLRVTIFKEGKMQITQITDWMPESKIQEQLNDMIPSPIFQPEIDNNQAPAASETETHVTLELAELGLSIIDHMPEEILYFSVLQLLLSYSSGMGSGINRFKLRMQWVQVDNQLPFTPMPVLFSPQRVENQADFVLKFSMTMQCNNSLDDSVYPYVGLQVPEGITFLVNIHEPIIWNLHEMFQHVKINRIYDSQPTAVSVDPMIKISVLNISEIRFRVSLAMAPSQRPRGVLGFWSSLMTALGNMEHMPVRIAERFHEDINMRQSALVNSATSNIQKDVLSQPFHLLSGVDILGNASSALSNMSKGLAALSMDNKFIQSRQKQENKGVEDIGDVLREGGGALAKGIFRGVTGILTKPIEGAKSSGVEGFVQGVGRGIIGAAAQPVSGVLDLLSKTTEGANAVKSKLSSAIMSEGQLQRRRLPRVIGGDSLLCPYDEHKAVGQAILHLAQSGGFLGQVDLFKVRGIFAFSDAYEDHFLLPKGKVIVITHRRVLLLQQPTMAQRKFNPSKDPCSVIWDVVWDNLATMELTRGKKDPPGSLPSRLILYLDQKSADVREDYRLIKCQRESEQATLVYSSIDKAFTNYGPNSSKESLRRKVPRPYAPHNSVSYSAFFRDTSTSWGSRDDQTFLSANSSFDLLNTQMLDDQGGH